MKLGDLAPGQSFRLPHPNSPTFTITEHIPGNPAALTVAWCVAPNLERLVPKANGDNAHRQDESEHLFSAETVVADYCDFADGI